MSQLASAIVPLGRAQVEDNQEVEPIVIQGWARDNENVFSGSIHRRQQVVVQDDVFVRGSGVVDEFKMVLQDSQVLNDQKLLEVVQYTHNHVSNTVANTEKRLERHVQDYLEGLHSVDRETFEYEARSSKKNEEIARKTALRTQEIMFEQQDAQISTLSTQLAQIHGDAIERRLQEKLTHAMKECQSLVQRHTDLRIADGEKKYEIAQEIAQRQTNAAINTTNATIESKLEKQLTASHNDTTMEQKAAKPEALAEICLVQQELHEIKKLCIDQGARLSSRVSKLKKKVPKSEPEVKLRGLEQELRDIKQLTRGRGAHFSLPVSHLEPKRPKPAANSVPSRQTISSRSNNLVDAEEAYSTKGTSD
ncbi:unnamed protein product [Phytophthora fragariaefolia]|uniref:Unnamed protein product n=1 Tax=Phytophthora fragariaefolia TaxID=1490495 RepID=A0A9W6XC73_9STRA|nr:unnamed protein product [Phytophthora fragariaefolia]